MRAEVPGVEEVSGVGEVVEERGCAGVAVTYGLFKFIRTCADMWIELR